MRSLLRIAVTLLALALSSLAIVAAATPAQAADYYRYWSYFHVESGGYTFSDKGVGGFTPDDGSVEAFRFAASSESKPNLPRVDPAVATFSAICGDQDAGSGQKRVAVIIDYGVAQDSEGQTVPGPEADCAEVPTAATALQVLQGVGQIRSKNLSIGPALCAIDGYPAKGCADVTTGTPTPADGPFLPVELAHASSSASPTDSASPSDSASATATDSALPTPGSSGDPGQDNNQDVEQGRGANPLPYLGLGVALFAIVGGGVYLARRRRRD